MFIVRSRTYGKGEAFRTLPTKKKRVEALFFLFGVFVVVVVRGAVWLRGRGWCG